MYIIIFFFYNQSVWSVRFPIPQLMVLVSDCSENVYISLVITQTKKGNLYFFLFILF